MTDPSLDLSPFRCLREISLALMVDSGLGHLHRASIIAFRGASKITITARLGSRAKELYEAFGVTGYGLADFDENLLRLAVFRGTNNVPPVELVIGLRQATSDCPTPKVVEMKGLRRIHGSK